MKPVLLSKFRPNKSQVARMWGTVNTILKTTDSRVSWYSCSGHGGYVANPADFTTEELAKLGHWAEGNYDVRVAVAQNLNDNQIYVIGANYESNKKIKYDSYTYRFLEWRKIPMMVFEEDCHWAILTYKLGIDLLEWEKKFSKAERMESARKCVEQWNPEDL